MYSFLQGMQCLFCFLGSSTVGNRASFLVATTTTLTSTRRAVATGEESLWDRATRLIPDAWDRIQISETLLKDQTGCSKNHALTCLLKESLQDYAHGVGKELAFEPDLDNMQESLRRYEDHRQTSSGVVAFLVLGHAMFDDRDNNNNNSERDHNHHDKDVDCRLFQEPEFRTLLNKASLLSGIHNDLQSHSKRDDSSSWDYVTIHQTIGGWTLEQARQAGIHRHEELIQDMARLANDLVEQKNYSLASVRPWTETILPGVLRGFVIWQSHVRRYQRTEGRDDAALLEALFPNQQAISLKSLQDRVQHEGDHNDDASLLAKIREQTWAWLKHKNDTTTATLATAVATEFDDDDDCLWNLCEKMVLAADPALCALCLYGQCSSSKQKLLAASRFFTLILLMDDLMENPLYHEAIKNVF